MALPGAESLGMSPFMVMQLILGMYAVLYWHKHGFVIPTEWKSFSFWLLSFALVSLASAFTLPFLFNGIRIYTPKGGIDQQYLSPGILEFSSSNVAQSVYLTLYVIGILIFIMRYSTTILVVVNRAYLFAGIVVCGFSYYQLVSLLTGIYYPSEILYSNENIDLAGERSISFVPRVHSTFSESSFYSIFMSSFLAWVYIKFINEPDKRLAWRWLFLLIGTFFSLLLSTASTGYATVTLFLLLHTLSTLVLGGTAVKRRRMALVLGSLALILVAVYFIIPGADFIFNEIVFDKGTSESSRNRFESDRFAFSVLFETHFLGAGLGSSRPSSALSFLVSNVGILGTFCITMAIAILFLKGIKAMRLSAADPHYKITCQAAGWALFVMFLAKVLGGPDLNFPPMWMLMGYFILSIMKLDISNTKSQSTC